MTAGFLTGLREGVEAALIVAIILAYLVRTGNGAQAGKVWLGAGLAIILSVAVGVAIFATAGSFAEPYEQIWEGTAMLVAAGCRDVDAVLDAPPGLGDAQRAPCRASTGPSRKAPRSAWPSWRSRP